MSQRELNINQSLQKWEGVDQRTSPVRVRDGFFLTASGCYFGLTENVERMTGKKLAGVMPQAVLSFFMFNNKVIIQTLTEVWMTEASQFFSLALTFLPFAPPAPTIGTVSFFSIQVTTPATFPLYTVSFTLQRSTDNVTWTTIATGLGTGVLTTDSGRTDATTYYYRVLSVNPQGSVPGPSVSATTPARLPDAPVAPSYTSVTTSGYTVIVPSLPAFAVTMDLQESSDNVSFATVQSGDVGGETYVVTGLPTGTTRYYRMVANNTRGSTTGPSSSVTTTSVTFFRLTETGDTRITESSDNRITQ